MKCNHKEGLSVNVQDDLGHMRIFVTHAQVQNKRIDVVEQAKDSYMGLLCRLRRGSYRKKTAYKKRTGANMGKHGCLKKFK